MKKYLFLLACIACINTMTASPLGGPPNSNDKSVWNDGKVSGKSDTITVASDANVLLSYSPDVAESTLLFDKLIVRGTVECPKSGKTILRGKEILVEGGTFKCDVFWSGSLEIYLSGKTSQITVTNGGRLVLDGALRTSWTRLTETANIGAETIRVPKTVDWKQGDEIVIAPTDFQFDAFETFQIKSVRQDEAEMFKELTLNDTMKHTHFGQFQTFEGKTLNSSAEVGLLTRNLKIYGDPTSFHEGFGVAIKIADETSFATIRGVEIRYAGWFDQMGKYAVHWHNVGEGSGQGITGSSIFMSKNRCVNIHCTDNVLIRNNICVDHIGHGFLTEEISEVGNKFHSNLGIGSRLGTGKLIFSEFVTKHSGVATFWTQNAQNEFYGNVAAGSAMMGFSYEKDESLLLKQQNESACKVRFDKAKPNYGKEPTKLFENNLAHSSNMNGFWFGFVVENFIASNLQVYKVRGLNPGPKTLVIGSCIWAVGRIRIFNALVADCQRGLWSQSGFYVFNSTIVGFSDNKGDPKTEQEISVGRTFPDFSITFGITIYDGPLALESISLINFNDLKTASGRVVVDAQGIRLQGGSTPSTKGYVKNMKFSNPDIPVIDYISYRYTGHFTDLDGSVSGKANTIVLAPIKNEEGQFYTGDPLLPSLKNCRFPSDNKAVFCDSSEKGIAIADVIFPNITNFSSQLKVKVGLDAGFKTSRLAFNGEKAIYKFPIEDDNKYFIQMMDKDSVAEMQCTELGVSSAIPGKTYNFVLNNVRADAKITYRNDLWSTRVFNAGKMGDSSAPVQYSWEERKLTLLIKFDESFLTKTILQRDGSSSTPYRRGKIVVC